MIFIETDIMLCSYSAPEKGRALPQCQNQHIPAESAWGANGGLGGQREIDTHTKTYCCILLLRLTLSSPAGATGSIIHDPNRDPDVLMVIGSDMPVSFPQAEKQKSTNGGMDKKIPTPTLWGTCWISVI